MHIKDKIEKELKEKLAAIEHQRWSDWQDFVFRCCKEGENGSLVLGVDKVLRWKRQIGTHYEQLSDEEKESDMEQVDRYWPLIMSFYKETKIEMQDEIWKLANEMMDRKVKLAKEEIGKNIIKLVNSRGNETELAVDDLLNYAVRLITEQELH